MGEIYDTFTKKILMLSSKDAKKNIFTSAKDKNNIEKGEIINGIPSKISAEECENYFEKMLNDLILDLDKHVIKSTSIVVPPAMTERTELISCHALKNTTTKIACATKKI